jgi:hypothetical protein
MTTPTEPARAEGIGSALPQEQVETWIASQISACLPQGSGRYRAAPIYSTHPRCRRHLDAGQRAAIMLRRNKGEEGWLQEQVERKRKAIEPRAVPAEVRHPETPVP